MRTLGVPILELGSLLWDPIFTGTTKKGKNCVDKGSERDVHAVGLPNRMTTAQEEGWPSIFRS